MEVITEKSKIRGNSPTNVSADITINGEKLYELISLKYMYRCGPSYNCHGDRSDIRLWTRGSISSPPSTGLLSPL
ncbi:hypothetical protein DPMN_135319 [Dreissena polymorpha]|uniref:Uncharacterized protein n=1 Tax=Dreissena polymorpha TaxID=45954 RepID=A0A9D4JFP1_DREPO|nr:hypothetical protein DPMN_135319 [Dreissena polymorpha]